MLSMSICAFTHRHAPPAVAGSHATLVCYDLLMYFSFPRLLLFVLLVVHARADYRLWHSLHYCCFC